jgi:hypothetical protein
MEGKVEIWYEGFLYGRKNLANDDEFSKGIC